MTHKHPTECLLCGTVLKTSAFGEKRYFPLFVEKRFLSPMTSGFIRIFIRLRTRAVEIVTAPQVAK